MSNQQTYILQQGYSFQAGLQDRLGGVHFDSRKNQEWKRGWKWANENSRAV